MTAVMTQVHEGRRPRWLMPVLVGSLALNLLVIGAVGSLLWRGQLGGSEELERRVIPSVLGYAVTTLPPERINEVERETRAEMQEVQPARRELRKVRTDWASALSAEPFDRERFLAAHARLVEADRRYRDTALKLYVALGLNLTPEERRAFADWRRQQQRGRGSANPLDRPRASGQSAQ